jgi:hypothetical protein
MICSTARDEKTRSVTALYFAIDILQDKKEQVVHENMDVWLVLCHAKQHLQSQL